MAAIQHGQRVAILTNVADVEVTLETVEKAAEFLTTFNLMRIVRINHKPPEISVSVRITMPEVKEQSL